MKRKTLVTAAMGVLLFSSGALANDFLNDPVKYIGLYNAQYDIQVNDRPRWSYHNSDLIHLPGAIDYPNGGKPPVPPHIQYDSYYGAEVPNRPPYVLIDGAMYVPLRRLANDLGLQIEFVRVVNMGGEPESVMRITGNPKSASPAPGAGSGTGANSSSSGAAAEPSSTPATPSTTPPPSSPAAIAAPEGPTEFKGAQTFRTNGYSKMILHKPSSNTLLGFTIKYSNTQSYIGFRELPFIVDISEMERITVEPEATSAVLSRTAQFTVEFLR